MDSLSNASAKEQISAFVKSCLPLLELYRALGGDSGAHLVGGSVRDVLLGLQPSDLDLATALSPQEVKTRLNSAGFRTIDTGLSHGTVMAMVGSEPVEITTFRLPLGAPAGALPSIESDLSARDFTINSMAYGLVDEVFLDPNGGFSDLKAKILKAVGSPAVRFQEDPLRIMRMLRIGTAAGLTLDSDTRAAARDHSERISAVSVERIRVELEKILIAPQAAEALREMQRLKLLDILFPELAPMVGFEQNKYHTQDVWEHTLSVIERAPFDLTLRLTALFHDSGKPGTLSIDQDGERHFYEHEVLSTTIAETIMERLRFSNEQIRSVTALVRLHMRPLEVGPSGLRRIMRDAGELFEQWKSFKRADATPKIGDDAFNLALARFETLEKAEADRLKGSPLDALAIDGDDLKGIGYAEGRELGAVLKELGELIIEDPSKNEAATLLDLARRRLPPRL